MDHTNMLGEGRVSRLLWQFSLPAITAMLVNALYNVIDRIFVGNSVGKLGIAGITIDFPIMLIIMAFGMLVGLGANALVSIRLGEQKKDEAEVIMGNALVLLIIISLVLSFLGILFLEPMLRVFGASPEVMPYAKDFMQVLLPFIVFQGVGFGMNNFIRGEGNPKTAMYTMLLGAILNTILCPIFIFGFGWGVKGSALATVIAQGVAAAWVLHYFIWGKSLLKLRRRNLKLNRGVVLKIMALGSAPFALQMAASLVNMILNKSLEHYGGDTAISGMGIVMSVVTLVMMPVIGIAQGAQPIIGYNYGAQKFDRVRKALKLAIMAATGIVTFGFVVIETFPRQIVSLFNSADADLINFGVYAIRVFLIFLPIIGFQIITGNYFQAVGKPKQAAFLSLSRQLLLLVPAVVVLPLFFQLHGVLMAGPVADLGSSILAAVAIYREMKELGDKHDVIRSSP